MKALGIGNQIRNPEKTFKAQVILNKMMKRIIEIKGEKMVQYVGQYCKLCKYEWTPRKKNPRQCPNCKRQIK